MKIINRIPKHFPLDPIENDNYPRKIQYCYTKCNPDPIENPKLVCISNDCLKLLNIKDIDGNFIDYFSGNKNIPNSIPLAHCYSGYQFGIYAGQLGDGRAHLIGDIIGIDNKYYEIQLKGSGKTPFSRNADGRAVLRSSIREFLCSEFMFYLGIPTTRSGSIITSDTIVTRDKNYDGNISYENATVISRIAPSFIRFGSFNVADINSCENNINMIKNLTEYIINNYHTHINNNKSSQEDKVMGFFKQVIYDTANLVALWQAYGFIHGVLNTDNMSILGLTIDFGPFAFMETYNPDITSNTSDKNDRYIFRNQPKICKWNLLKLAQSLGKCYSNLENNLIKMVDDFCDIYKSIYLSKMTSKFGFVQKFDDKQLIDSFLDLLYESQGDYTNIFRSLLNLHLFDNNDGPFLNYLKSQCKNYNDDIHVKWINWINNYKKRTLDDFYNSKDNNVDACVLNRLHILENNNPKFILRNSMVQKAINLAEKGNYNEINNLLNLLKKPYCEINEYGKNEYLNIDKKYNVALSCSS